MRKLVLCELFKYRRNKVIPALTSLSLLFPLALIFMTKSDLNGAETLAEYHAYYDSLFNNNLVYSSMLLLPALFGCISAVLFFTGHTRHGKGTDLRQAHYAVSVVRHLFCRFHSRNDPVLLLSGACRRL